MGKALTGELSCSVTGFVLFFDPMLQLYPYIQVSYINADQLFTGGCFIIFQGLLGLAMTTMVM